MLTQPKNKIYYFFVATFFVVVFFLAYNFSYQENKKTEEIIKGQSLYEGLSFVQVCFEKTCFNVEIADTPNKQQIGLMNRESLDEDKGMLFVFDTEDKYKFWMKNTLIPLDIIWIDSDKKIIFIQKNAQPCKTEQCETFGPDKNAKYVLEINGGLIYKMKVEIGSEVEIRISKT